MATVTLGGVVYEEIVQAKLRKWLELEAIRDNITKEAEDTDKQANLVCEYLSASLSISTAVLSTLNWKEIAKAFIEVATANTVLLSLPFMKVFGDESDGILSWDYPGRNWWSLCKLLAKEFGWSIEYVENLDVETAMHIIQEVLISEQLDKEWQWLLSERAVKYNESTKKSEANPLPRPNWMRPVPTQPKMIKIRKDFIPVGIVIKAKRPDEAIPIN